MRVEEREGYVRTLGLFDLSNLGVAAIIGAGIFVFLGQEAIGTGPAVVVALALGGLAAILAAFSYAEAAAMLPGNGSAYAFSFAAFGSLPAFLVGWFFLNTYAIGNAGVSIGWAGFLKSGMASLGWALPEALTQDPAAGGLVNLPALLFFVVITFLACLGVRTSTRVNNLLVVLKLGIVLFVIVAGAFMIKTANWADFSPAGVKGIAGSTAVLFFAYLGFDTIAATGAEAKNPRRTMPLAILISIALCTVLYILMAGVVTGIAPHATLNPDAPVADAFAIAGLPWAAHVITVGAMIGLATVAYAFHIAMARILQAMAEDGFAPKILRRVSRNGAPVPAAMVVGVISATAAGFIPLANVIDMAVEASVVIFIMVSVGTIVVRRMRGTPDGFHVPEVFHWAAVLALLGVIVFGNAPMVHVLSLAWLAIGLMIYGFWAHRSSLRAHAENSAS